MTSTVLYKVSVPAKIKWLLGSAQQPPGSVEERTTFWGCWMGCLHILCEFIVFGTLEMNGSNRGVTQPASHKHLPFGRGRNARPCAR